MAKTRQKQKKPQKPVKEIGDNLNSGPEQEAVTIKGLTAGRIKELITKDRYFQLVLILSILSAFLRFYHLDFNSLWLDEASTFDMSKASFMEIWNFGLSGDIHPPLFHWIEHIMLVFGQSEFVLRFVPALLGTLTIPVFYFIGREFRDRNVGIISAALLTVSYFGIFYSQEAYSYSMVLFVFSIVILFYLRALRTDTVPDWVLFGIFSAIAFWTHYYVFVPIAVIYLHAVFTLRHRLKKDIREAKKILLSFVVMTVLILPLILVVIGQYLKITSSAPTYGVLGPALIPETFIRLSGGYSPFNGIIAAVYVILMLGGLAIIFTEDRNKCLFSVMYLVLPLVFSVILSSRMTMNPRYLIYLLPVFFTMIAMSYPLMFRFIPNRKLLYFLVAAIIAVNAPLLVGYYSSFTKEDWRGFSRIVQGVTREGDLVVVVPGYLYQPFTYYYDNTTDKTMRYGAYTGKDLDDIYRLKGDHSIFYVVTGDISAANPNGDAIAWLSQNAKAETQHTGIYLLSSR